MSSQNSTPKAGMKNISLAVGVIGIIMFIIGIIKVSIIGYYPDEVWWSFGLVLVGGLAGGIALKVHHNLS